MRIYPDKVYAEHLLAQDEDGIEGRLLASGTVDGHLVEIIEVDSPTGPRKFARYWDLVVGGNVVFTLFSEKGLNKFVRLVQDALDSADFEKKAVGIGD